LNPEKISIFQAKMHANLDILISKLTNALNKNPSILFAYLHGSVLSSEHPKDVDIAVYLRSGIYDGLVADGGLSIDFAIPLEMELEKILGEKVDVQVINRAPLSFRYRVLKMSKLLVDNDSNTRCDFEYLSMVEYFDFKPRYQEYFQEVIT